VIIVVVSVDGNKILLVVLVRAMAQAVSSGLSTRKPGFAPGSAQVGFMVDRMALGQVYFRVLRISPLNIIQPWLHNHIIVYHLEDEKMCVSGRRSGTHSDPNDIKNNNNKVVLEDSAMF
jgi:hypothetical protein